MKKQTMQSTLALSLSMIFAVSSMASCSKDKKTQSVQTADKVLNHSFQAMELDTSSLGEASVLDAVYSESNDTVYLLANDFTAETNKIALYKADKEFSSVENIPIVLEETEDLAGFDVDSQNNIIVITCISDYGDMTPPDYNDPNFDYENFDFEAFAENTTNTYHLKMFDSDYNMTSDSVLYEMNGNVMLSAPFSLEDGTVIYEYTDWNEIKNATKLVHCDLNGKVINEHSFEDNQYINALGKNSKGGLSISYTDDTSVHLANINTDSMELENEQDAATLNYSTAIVKGFGDYNLYINGENGIYGATDDKIEEILNWVDSDIKSNNASNFIALPDNEFIVIEMDYSTNKSTIYLLTARDISELENTKIITLGVCYTGDAISDAVSTFNKTNTEYRIKVKNYSEYATEENEYTGAAKQLTEDFLAGKGPDIVDCGSFTGVAALESKGCFTDLYAFLDKDTELNRDFFLPNILKCSEHNGKIYNIPINFCVDTFAGKPEFVGDKANWTTDEMIAAYKNAPENMEFITDAYRDTLINYFLMGCVGNYINYDTKECNCDTEEFTKLLDFAKEFPKDDRNWEEMDWENYDYEAEEIRNATDMRNNSAFLKEVYFSCFDDMHQLYKGVFNNEPITFVGYPSSTGAGAVLSMTDGLAISESSPSKDACWEFIKNFYTEEYQIEKSYYGFPTTVELFDKAAEMALKESNDEEYNRFSCNTTYSLGRELVDIGAPTKEDIEAYKEYLLSIDKSYSYDGNLYILIEDEVDAFINDKQSSEDTVNHMIDRVQTYLSEQF